MKKKKTIKTILIIILILAALTGGVFLALLLNGTFSQKLASGKYYIQGNDKYKDAYIEVKGDQIQFYNIDLNDALGTVAIKRYEKVIAKKPDKKLSEEEFNSYFDYNKNFVDSPYTIEYIADGTNKLGTYKYYHFMSIGCIYSTFVIHYDSWEKTIDIVLDGNSLLTFKKK
ncbi:MAG: hypothetical protein K6F17_08940 [Lachnospiraceae bacterium]|nr:hypothetical protein [Lachnospiraceae bacterium]